MESVLDPSALPHLIPTVTYDPKSETVALPSGVVSVAKITVMTGGTEMSWGSCMLAFGFWGLAVGLSTVSVGLWEKSVQKDGNISLLLPLGFAVLALSSGVMVGVFSFRFFMRRTGRMKHKREESKLVLVGGGDGSVVKLVTV